jgi:hypothetical protein
MSVTLVKTDPTCSNVQLIDANVCVGDSIDILNNNITNLADQLNSITNFINNSINNNKFLSVFYNSSATMLRTMLDISIINEAYKDPYTTIAKLSTQWDYKQFSIHYPTIVKFVDYYVSKSQYDLQFLDWINNIFPTSLFPQKQIINFYVSLQYTDTFDFVFKGDYYENCATTNVKGITAVSCNECKGDTRFGGCNHDARGKHWCDNAYGYCNGSKPSGVETYSCQGLIQETYKSRLIDTFQIDQPVESYGYAGNSGDLKIDYERTGLEDRFIARIIKFTIQSDIDPDTGELTWGTI